MKNLKVKLFFALLSVCFIFTLTFAEEQLIFAATIIRHGDRAPYDPIKSSVIKYEWPMGISELTPEGMNQEYLLGKKMRERYVKKYKLIPPNYKQGSIYVLSTHLNRTIMSAQSFLAGLYPNGTGPKMGNGKPSLPNLFQPIPLRTIPSGERNIIDPGKWNQQEYKRLMNEYAFTQPEWVQKNKELAADFDRWNKILGTNIKDLNDFLVPSDHIYCMYVHNIPMPKDLTSEDVQKIIDLKMWATAKRFFPKEIAYFMASPFITQLVEDMQAVLDNKQNYKYYLYSGHDDSILGIMSALGVPLDANPPYAAHIDFELYKDGSDYFVKVFYNDKQLGLIDGKKRLTFDEFKEFVKPYLTK